MLNSANVLRYIFAEQDATQALKADADHGPLYTSRFTPKAYFRRAQARRHIGVLDEAEQGEWNILLGLRSHMLSMLYRPAQTFSWR